MIAVDISARTLARIRLAPSPASDIWAWLTLTSAGRRHPIFGDPGAEARFALRDPDVAMLADLARTRLGGYIPDLLTSRPGSGSWAETFTDQVATVRATPTETVVKQLAKYPEHGAYPAALVRAAENGTFPRRAADGLRRFWAATIADRSQHLLEIADADIEMRARMMARLGIGSMLATLHAQVHWSSGRLMIDKPYDVRVCLDDSELVLSPSVLAWPALRSQVHVADQAFLAYPVRSFACVRGGPGTDLTGLLGISRASILNDLGAKRSTTELSRRLGLAPSTVSHHLRILLHNGMVSSVRDGAAVLYRRTERGESLLSNQERRRP